MTDNPVDIAKMAGVSFQPLIDRLAELASLETLVLLVVIAVLLFQNHSERKRNADAYTNQVSQAASIVKVLTSHQNTLQNIEKSLNATSSAMLQLHSKHQELSFEVRCLNSTLKPSPKRRAPTVRKGAIKS